MLWSRPRRILRGQFCWNKEINRKVGKTDTPGPWESALAGGRMLSRCWIYNKKSHLPALNVSGRDKHTPCTLSVTIPATFQPVRNYSRSVGPFESTKVEKLGFCKYLVLGALVFCSSSFNFLSRLWGIWAILGIYQNLEFRDYFDPVNSKCMLCVSPPFLQEGKGRRVHLICPPYLQNKTLEGNLFNGS